MARDGFEPPSTGNEPGELPLLHPANTYKNNVIQINETLEGARFELA
jgi:hypothetical protein